MQARQELREDKDTEPFFSKMIVLSGSLERATRGYTAIKTRKVI